MQLNLIMKHVPNTTVTMFSDRDEAMKATATDNPAKSFPIIAYKSAVRRLAFDGATNTRFIPLM